MPKNNQKKSQRNAKNMQKHCPKKSKQIPATTNSICQTNANRQSQKKTEKKSTNKYFDHPQSLLVMYPTNKFPLHLFAVSGFSVLQAYACRSKTPAPGINWLVFSTSTSFFIFTTKTSAYFEVGAASLPHLLWCGESDVVSATLEHKPCQHAKLQKFYCCRSRGLDIANRQTGKSRKPEITYVC